MNVGHMFSSATLHVVTNYSSLCGDSLLRQLVFGRAHNQMQQLAQVFFLVVTRVIKLRGAELLYKKSNQRLPPFACQWRAQEAAHQVVHRAPRIRYAFALQHLAEAEIRCATRLGWHGGDRADGGVEDAAKEIEIFA